MARAAVASQLLKLCRRSSDADERRVQDGTALAYLLAARFELNLADVVRAMSAPAALIERARSRDAT